MPMRAGLQSVSSHEYAGMLLHAHKLEKRMVLVSHKDLHLCFPGAGFHLWKAGKHFSGSKHGDLYLL